MREDARMALLPQAFARQSPVWVWIDPEAGWLVTDASSQTRADEVLTALARAFIGLSLTIMNTRYSPELVMKQWLIYDDELPTGLCIERGGELKSRDKENSVVRYTRHTLRTEDVRQHLWRGMRPTKLALSLEGRVSFVLTESMQLRKLAFLDGVFNDRPSDEEEGFDADVALATGELRKLLPVLLEALGGELMREGSAA